MIEDLYVLEDNIRQWGVDRNITEEGGVTAQDQISKMIEELAECVSTLGKIESTELEILQLSFEQEFCSSYLEACEQAARHDYLLNVRRLELEQKLKDDYGDMIVCIIQAMRMSGTDMTECLNQSWNEIKDRKGYMMDGKFVKVED